MTAALHREASTGPLTAVVVGAGGTGYHLAPPLARLLAARRGSTLVVVDGKEVRNANLTRQHGRTDVGCNKADVLAGRIVELLGADALTVEAVPVFLEPGERAVHDWLDRPNLHVFSCVDNFGTRAYLETELGARRDATMVDGGNDEFDGQASLWVRRNGVDVTPRPTAINPEARAGDQRLPSQIPCDEAVVSQPQLVLANLQSALAMLSLWYAFTHEYPTDGVDTAALPNYARFDVRRASLVARRAGAQEDLFARPARLVEAPAGNCP